MASSASEWKPKGRPMSTIAFNFSVALDDLFKLGSVGELKESVEEKNRAVASQKSQLEDLDDQLRRADQELQRLEKKHKRMSRRLSPRQAIAGLFDYENQQSSSDTDEASSPRSELGENESQTQEQ